MPGIQQALDPLFPLLLVLPLLPLLPLASSPSPPACPPPGPDASLLPAGLLFIYETRCVEIHSLREGVPSAQLVPS